MDGYNEDDRRAAYEALSKLERLEERLARLETVHTVSLRRIRRLPDLTATAMTKALGKRALFLIGLGLAAGSALGGAGVELARKLIATAIGGP